MASRPRFDGAVLAGGRSTRMGTDKALLGIDGQPLLARVANVLREAGAEAVIILGASDAVRSATTTFDHHIDDRPGEGPAAATVTALAQARNDFVVVAACDLVRLDAETVTQLVDTLAAGEHDAAVPVVEGRPQFHLAAYRRELHAVLEARVDSGIRSMHALLDGLSVAEVVPRHPDALRDADSPGDL